MTEHKKGRLIRYLIYLALVTSVIASVTLAKFTSASEAAGRVAVAAFAAGTTLDLEIPLADMLAPGDVKTVEFAVTNFDGENNSDVVLDYEIQLETTRNLPLEFSLLGEKESDDTEVISSVLVGQFDENLHAVGGRLPIVSVGGRKTHTYRLTIRWPENQDDQDYSGEIDRLVLQIITKQASVKGALEG